MDTSKVDLNLLVTLEALLTERNVSKAAGRLHLSQPAVSAQLSRLRDMFGDPLLIPAHRGMMPTAKALELLEPLRQALDQVRNALESHKAFSPAAADFTMTIAGSDYVQVAVLIPLILTLRQQAPGVRIAVRHLNPALIQQQLANGEVDLAVATPEPYGPHLRTRHLYDETYVLIGRRDHPQLNSELGIEAYVRLEHVVVSRWGGGFSSPIDDVLAALGYRRNVVMSAASFLFIPELVLASDLVALVPRRLLRSQVDKLMSVEIPWLPEPFNISLIWHERSHGHTGQKWLRERIAELCSDQTATS